MAEYIEIEQLWKCETCYHNDWHGCTLELGCDHGESYRPAYRKLKKADVAPVVHGRWVEHEFEDEPCYGTEYECSACGRYQFDNTPYCPNCGARMDGGNAK